MGALSEGACWGHEDAKRMQGDPGLREMHLSYSMYSMQLSIVFDFFFLPALSPCCNADLNSLFPSPTISTVVHSALCRIEVREMIPRWGRALGGKGGSPVKIYFYSGSLFQREAL